MKARVVRMLLAWFTGVVLALGAPPPSAQAGGFPVIDVAALAELIKQVIYWERQIKGMMDQLNQLRETYSAITGGRGMEALLPYTSQERNYLPADYAELMNVVNNASVTYSGLANQVQSIMAANSVLTGGQVAALSPRQQRIVNEGRQAAAMLQMITRAAHQNTSQRFAALQQLIWAIGRAGDDKAIQDLQGRIAAEQTMLTVEQTKLQSLYQMAQAQELQRQQMVREGAAQAAGSITTARHPSFP